MHEGWLEDHYIILFDESEWPAITEQYGLAEFLDGYRVEGLHGWVDFILRDSLGNRFLVPTVPLTPQYIKPFERTIVVADLVADPKVAGQIRWYVKPIAFGGSYEPGENLTWVSFELHAELVRWWNRLYRDLKQGGRRD
jgi:hypothetical protein